jgi:glycosyltransferase involved in cell wall biosynthesis
MSERSDPSPLVSVILLACQQPVYLNEALRSIAQQTYPASSIEILIIDDRSDEGCIAQYRLPPHAQLIVNERREACAAISRNRALRAARGRYVAFLDQDDLWLPEKLAIQVAALEAAPEAILHSTHYTRVGDDLRPLARQYAPALMERDPLKPLLRRNWVCYSAVMMRREALDKLGGFDESIRGAADWDMWLRAAAAGRCIGDARSQVLYRQHEQQWSRDQVFIARGAAAVTGKAALWLAERRPALVPLARRRHARWLRELARAQLAAGQHSAETLSVLRDSARLAPFDPRTYGLMWRASRLQT